MKERDIKDLIQFITEGKKKMLALEEQSSNLKRQDNIVLIVGTTGVGKSTLVNYLNGIKLECILTNRQWKVDLKDQEQGLLGGFKIGHSTADSETIYPGIYSPSREDFSYIDCPGFGDSRGLKIEIGNLFF